jgi:integrase
MSLTDISIKTKLAKFTDKRIEHPDGKVGGLYLIQQPSGAASWALRYRANGKPTKLTLGNYPTITLADARRRAREALGEVAGGKDPAVAKKAARAALKAAETPQDTVGAFAATFLRRRVREKCGPRWAAETERLLKVEILPKLGDVPLSDLKRARIHDFLDPIKDRAPIVANRVLAVLKSICSFAVDRGLIDVSPLAGMKLPSEEKSRDRVLTDDELARIWKAADSLRAGYGPAVRMLMLTGQRLGEVSGMRRSEIAGDTWTLPGSRTKNGLAHTIPLTPQALALLPSESGDGGDRMFGPLLNWGRAKAALDAACGVKGWRLHDLRRSFATNFQRLGIRLEVTEAVLSHVGGSRAGVVGIYQRHDWASEKRQALDAWARRLDAIISGAEASNVVEMRRGV